MDFNVYKEKITIDFESMHNAEVVELWDLDKSKKKTTATKAILYVFFCEDLSDKNPLSQLSYNEKHKHCLLRAFGDMFYDIEQQLGTEWSVAIKTARASYYKNNVADALKDVATLNKKMDELGEMLLDTEPEIRRNVNSKNDKVSFSTNIEIINKALNSVISMIQSKASLLALHIQGTIPKHLRGGLSPMSKGKIKTKI